MMKFTVEGMTCGHCVQAITRALAAVPGVKSVASVDLKTGEVALEGSPEPATVGTAVEKAGYKVRLSP